uniref:Uncharacterized protein n=1 Tax=Strigamia maritima TaxID=126957 RepID=T1J5Y1_STRMM
MTTSAPRRTFRTEHGLQNEPKSPTKIPKTAEELAAESMAANMDEIVYYDAKESIETLDEWLESFKPSEILREDGVGWIVAMGKTDNCEDSRDVINLQKAWKDLVESKAPITYDNIKTLAIKYNVTTGKWLFHVPTGSKVDFLWRIIATNVVKNNLDGFSFSAKVSPYNPEESNHVISVYNHNYTNDQEVFSLEKAIRLAGVKRTLHYKPDVFTYCGIYRRNKWELRPTIYKSDYNLKNKQSEIMSHDETLVCTNELSKD